MAWPKTFTGSLNTDIDATGIGASKVSGATGAYKLTGFARAYRASASVTTYYQFSDTPTDKNYRVALSVFVDSTTLLERIGITMRDTSTNATTGRNMVHYRLRTESSTSAFLEIFGVVGGSFPGTANASAGFSIAANANYTFICEALDDQFTIYAADGTTVLCGPVTISDAVLQNAGKTGLYSSGTSTAATPGATDGNGTGTHIVGVDFAYLGATTVTPGDVAASSALTQPSLSITGSLAADDLSAATTLDAATMTVASLALLSNFEGANASASGTVITGASTLSPVVNLAIRNPEGGTPLFQHFLFGLDNTGAPQRDVVVNLNLTNQEGGNFVRSTWAGPYQCASMDDFDGWAALARSETGGILTFVVTVPANAVTYISSMPPNTKAQVLDFLAFLVSAFPGWIHDDTTSRLAFNSGPYVSDVAPTVLDELGRTWSGQPMLSFRVGNDSVGTPKNKKRVVLYASLHPGEHHGFIQLRGYLIQWLTSVALASARDNVELWVYPLGAPNGVPAGYRRYEPRVGYAQGDNLNREWKSSSLNGTAQKWQDILDTDHGVGFNLVKGLVDFHDLAHSTQIVTVYHRAESANLAQLLAIISAEFTSEQILESTNADTTTDYFVNTKGVGPAFTAEVSDQSTGLAGFLSIGASWANVVGSFYAGEYLGPLDANLSVNGMVQAATLDQPTLSGTWLLTPNDLTSEAPLTLPTISPVYVLAPADLASAADIGTPSVTIGGVTLSIAALTSQGALEAPNLTADASLQIQHLVSQALLSAAAGGWVFQPSERLLVVPAERRVIFIPAETRQFMH